MSASALRRFVEPPLVEQSGLVVRELGDSSDEPAVAHADVCVAGTRPVDYRGCEPSGDHGTTSEQPALLIFGVGPAHQHVRGETVPAHGYRRAGVSLSGRPNAAYPCSSARAPSAT